MRSLRSFDVEEADLFVVFVIVALVSDVNGCKVDEYFRRSTDLPFWSRLGLSFFLTLRNPQKDIGHVDAALSTSTSSTVAELEGGRVLLYGRDQNSQGCIREM